jgi:hypothetical protein
MKNRKRTVSVIGGHRSGPEDEKNTYETGKAVAEAGFVLVCGGLSGIMEAACKGARAEGGTTVGIIPGEDTSQANPFVDIVIPTGMGYTRNTLVACCSDIVVALPGSYGTLSEIAFALNAKKTVYSFGSWEIKGTEKIASVSDLKAVLRDEQEGSLK